MVGTGQRATWGTQRGLAAEKGAFLAEDTARAKARKWEITSYTPGDGEVAGLPCPQKHKPQGKLTRVLPASTTLRSNLTLEEPAMTA